MLCYICTEFAKSNCIAICICNADFYCLYKLNTSSIGDTMFAILSKWGKRTQILPLGKMMEISHHQLHLSIRFQNCWCSERGCIISLQICMPNRKGFHIRNVERISFLHYRKNVGPLSNSKPWAPMNLTSSAIVKVFLLWVTNTSEAL